MYRPSGSRVRMEARIRLVCSNAESVFAKKKIATVIKYFMCCLEKTVQ